MRALDQGLGCCPACHKTVKVAASERRGIALCPRCGSEVHSRKPESIQYTWALLVASVIFFIPANLLPMMYVESFTGTGSDTIMSGVIYFVASGSYLIAFVIFTASIVVPIIKMMIIAYLLVSVQNRSCLKQKMRKRLYILTEIIGRWSMVDVYVVGIMVALVHFGGLAEIKAGPGINYFLLVVVVTMLAAMKFDPRLIWDIKECHEK